MEVISEYERQRLGNIQRNNELLRSLDIDKHKPVIPIVHRRRAVKRKLEDEEDGEDVGAEGQSAVHVPQRRSARLQHKEVEHSSLPASFDDDGDSEEVQHRSHNVNVRLRSLPDVPPLAQSDAAVGQQSQPTRDAEGRFGFTTNPEFRPNLSPKEIIQLGSFGGGYFRKIHSRVTKSDYEGDYKEFPEDWFEGQDVSSTILRSVYDPAENKYKIKAGQGLIEWEDSGWITAQDPRGWFQWYCRFFLGRRSPDDERQIGRWRGVAGSNGRWKKDLVSKIVRSGKNWDDATVSPTVRQTLQHWAYQLTESDYNAFV